MKTKLRLSQQENLLTLLTYHSKQAFLIRNAIGVNLFEGIYNDIADRIFTYIDQYKKIPEDHLPDLFDDIIQGEDNRKATAFTQILLNIHNSKDNINVDYTMSTLEKFVRQQHLKAAVMEVIPLLDEETSDALAKAEVVLAEAQKRRLSLFNPGLRITDTDISLDFEGDKEDILPTGIKHLDERDLGPIRGGLHLFIGLIKQGKTWHLINLAKYAMMTGHRVCHVTLEMSEKKMARRYIQTMFGVSKRDGAQLITQFKINKKGRLKSIYRKEHTPKLSFDQPNIVKKLGKKIEGISRILNNLIIKQFPDGQLTIRELEAYLESLEATNKFIPDLLIVDYPDKMYIPTKDYRLSLGKIMTDLRGLAVSRNIAVAVVTQSNREGGKSKQVDAFNVAEDFSKVAVADTIIAYNQTKLEKILGLARLYVAAAREDEDQFTVLINQNYATGVFAFDSVRMPQTYGSIYNAMVKEELDEGEDDD